MITPKTWAITLALALTGSFAMAEDNSALLDLLVKKKVITEKDADGVRSELDSQQADSSLAKLKLTDAVTSMTLGGDFKLRYQYQNQELQAANPGNNYQTSRWRYRLRLNADFQVGPYLLRRRDPGDRPRVGRQYADV
ncbi:MAG: hypothetical protein QM796_22250 [Chthoniobacteraceae bacterium]